MYATSIICSPTLNSPNSILFTVFPSYFILPSTFTVIFPVASSGISIVTELLPMLMFIFESTGTGIISFTINPTNVEFEAYIASLVNIASIPWAPIFKSFKLMLIVSFAFWLKISLPSNLTITVPVTSEGNVILTVAVSPSKMSLVLAFKSTSIGITSILKLLWSFILPLTLNSRTYDPSGKLAIVMLALLFLIFTSSVVLYNPPILNIST